MPPLSGLNPIIYPGFSPGQIAGLQAWYDANYGVYQDGAAHFTAASSQYLSIADNASLSMGSNTNFSIVAWVYADTQISTQTVLAKWGGAGQAAYAIYMPSNIPTLIVSSDGTANATVTTGLAMAAGGWHFLVAWYDGANINISIDNGTTHSTAFSAGVFDNTAQFQLSGISGGQFWNGSIDSVFVTKRVLTAAERTWLYNSGNGQVFANVASGMPSLNDASAISWWDLNEESGTRFDQIGTNDLTASNVALISGATLNGNFETAGTNGGTITNVPTSTVARTTNVATVVTSIAHGLSTGNVVDITGVVEAGFNSTGNVVTVVNSTTFTYPNTGSNVVSVSDTTGRVKTDVFGSWTESAFGSATISDETSIVHSGSHAVKLVSDSSGNSAGVKQSLGRIGDIFSYTVWARGAVGGEQLFISDAGQFASTPTLTTTYTAYSGSFTMANNIFDIQTNGTSYTIYADDVTLTDLGPVGIAGIAAGIAVDGNFCGQFNGTNQTLSVASNTSIQTGNVDAWQAGWLWFDKKDSTYYAFSKDNNSTAREVGLFYNFGSDVLQYLVGNGSGTIQLLPANHFGSPPLAGWIFALTWVDTTANTLNIRIDNGTADSATLTLTPGVTSEPLMISGNNSASPGRIWAGREDTLLWGKSPPGGIASVIDTISSTLFNSGKGLKAKNLTTGQIAAWGVVAGWDMDKQLGITADSIGSNTLTNNNAVTFAQGVDYFGGAVSKQLDRSSAANNIVQVTEALRPVWYSRVQNNKPGILYNGVSNLLEDASASGIPVGTSARTVFQVIKQTTVQNGFPLFWNAGASNHCGININGTFKAYLEDYYDSGISISNNTAYIVAFTYDGTNLATYVNDVAGATFTPTPPIHTGTVDLSLGALPGGVIPFNGYAFDGAIYNSALTRAQITQVFNYFKQQWGIS